MAKPKSVGRVRQSPKKASCLFHDPRECVCIRPVTDRETLIMRLRHQIRLNELNARFASEAEKADADAENAKLQARLDAALSELVSNLRSFMP